MTGRRRPRWRSLLSVLAIVAGLALVTDVVLTLVWQEPVSALRAWNAQRQLGQRLDDGPAAAALSPADQRTLAKLPDTKGRMAYAARRLRERAHEGDPLGRIVLPTQDRRYVLIDGDAEDDLKKGPGVYPATALPGAGGTTAIAGHRTTYLAPFREINELHRGDPIVIQMPYGTFTYAVQSQRIVDPSDTGVVRGDGSSRLVLTACHPLYSAAQRIVVFARLVRAVPTARLQDDPHPARARAT